MSGCLMRKNAVVHTQNNYFLMCENQLMLSSLTNFIWIQRMQEFAFF